MSIAIYRRFGDGIPTYLARHYWWAYLWRVGVWFFDHQVVINAILFGQYHRLMRASLQAVASGPGARNKQVLQLTCVYGAFTPGLLAQMKGGKLHLADVAPIQLALARAKVKEPGRLLPVRLNAESLSYRSGVFDRIIVFFLLHELPAAARRRVLAECVRVLAPGGRLLVTEYASLPYHHLLYRLHPSRWLLTRLEPFLDSFWHEDMHALLTAEAARQGKTLKLVSHSDCFARFYRVADYELHPHAQVLT